MTAKMTSARTSGRGDLFASIRDVIVQSRKAVAYGVNTAMVLTNYEIGRLIVEHEQKGADRAEYAGKTLKTVSRRLTAEFGKGYSVDNLERNRKFYLLWSKSATVSRISGKQSPKALTAQSGAMISATPSRKLVTPFRLSRTPKDNRQIFARKYQLYLPTKAQLRAQLKGVSV